MAAETTGDMSVIQDEELLRKMRQEVDDFGEKEPRSHMYKIREARLKDFYNAEDGTTISSSDNRSQRSTTTTTRTDSTTGLKGSDFTIHADNLADHSFLSLKSKEIRDSESPTKDSYKIIETRKIDDRDWKVVESNEASKDGKTHTTSRIATTSGRRDLDGGEMKYAAKSEQTASVHKDGDDKNFTKSVEASSQNVIKQEASGGDDNSKFYSTSTTSTSSSKFSNEYRSTTGDSTHNEPNNTNTTGFERIIKYDKQPSFDIPDKTLKTVMRKVYTENIPNELKNHPSYVDGNTKVTTETETLPDGSTVTRTRYETKGATQYSTSSSKLSSSSASKHTNSSNREQKSSSNVVKSHITTTEDIGRDFDDRSTRSDSIYSDDGIKIVKNKLIDSKSLVNTNNRSEVVSRKEEDDLRRMRDIELIGRGAENLRNVEITVKKTSVPEQEEKGTVTTTTITKSINSAQLERPDSNTAYSTIVTKTYTIPTQENQNTTTSTIVTRKIEPTHLHKPDSQTTTSTTVTKSYTIPTEERQTTTSTIVAKKIDTNYDKQRVASSNFLDTERHHVTQIKTTATEDDIRPIKPSREHIINTEHVFRKETVRSQDKPTQQHEPPASGTIEIKTPFVKDEPKYEQPERRQPIKPDKSELDERSIPTEGQYDTTYRTDYVPKRISVEVSPTHDAFARSLRSVSPDRAGKTGSTRSLRTISSTSLRSTDSPDKHPIRSNRGSPADFRSNSPVKKITRTPESPDKKSPHRIVTKPTDIKGKDTSTDTITRRQKTEVTTTYPKDTQSEVDSNTFKRNRPIEKIRSRSTSPTSIASDIEFIRHRTDIVTDLDIEETNRRNVEDSKFVRRHTEEFNNRPSVDDTFAKRPQKVTDKSATLPLSDLPAKRTTTSPTKEPSMERIKPKPIRRTDTYEERCKEILGIFDAKDTPNKQFPQIGSPKKDSDKITINVVTSASGHHITSHTRKSPPKKNFHKESPEKELRKQGTKPGNSTVQEFPSQIRKSAPKQSPEKSKYVKNAVPSAQESPSQVRKSPSMKTSEPYTGKSKDDKKTPLVQEFPSQIRKSSQKEPLESYPRKPKDDKKAPSVQEFPSQIRKSPQKESLEPYPEKPRDDKKAPSVQEFPSQIRKSPAKEPLEPYPEKPKNNKKAPSVQEFPSQIRKSPQKESLEPYPEKSRDDKKAPSVQEFPSQIRKSPTKEPLEPYPEKPKEDRRTPSLQEFPSQIRKSPTKEPLEPYPEKPKNDKKAPSVQEFPSQIRKSPQKESLEPYPEKPRDDKKAPSVQEFSSQIRKSPAKEPLEPYPEKPKNDKKAPSVQEFPSQIRKSPQKESLEPYPEKPRDDKKAPSVQEFPSQIRKSPTKEPLEPYPEKPKEDRRTPSLQEFPSQIRKSPTKEPLEHYPEKPKNDKKIPSVQEFPSQIKKSPAKEPFDKPKTIIDPKEPQHREIFDSENPEDYYRNISSEEDEPLQKEPNKVSLDDLPAIKRDKVSLDDIPATKKKTGRKPSENVSLDDLRHKPERVGDSFINNEKIDTEVTLKKYKDDAIRRPTGIHADVLSKTQKSILAKKTTSTTIESETGSTTEEEEQEPLDVDLESQIIEDVNDVVECAATETKSIQQLSKAKTVVKQPDDKTKGRIKTCQPQVEDFITVSKTQLLQSESKVPIDEPIQTKKFISVLAKEEEEDRLVQRQTTLTEKERKVIAVPLDSKIVSKPNKTVKKYSPDKAGLRPRTTDKKKQTEILIKNEKFDTTAKAKVDCRRTDSKKTPDAKIIPKTEYADQYIMKVKDKRTFKPVTSKVSTRIALAPVKQPVAKKPIQKETVNVIQKTDTVNKKNINTTKTIQIEKKRTTTAIPRSPIQKTIEVHPPKRHVVSTIINIKPKIVPETITKTIHKTTVTKTILSPKTTRIAKMSKQKPKPTTNGHVSTDEEESDIEIVEEISSMSTLKMPITPNRRSPLSKSADVTTERKKKCITTKSILIENAFADQREIIVDLKRSKSSREGTPDRICPYPVSTDSDLGRARYPDRVVEPDDNGPRSKPKRIADVPLDETEISEDTGKTTRTTELETTDECLLSVNEKVNKFLSTAEQVTKKPPDAKPAPKVDRPKLEIDDSLREDECLLSVSDKVHKFITTAEQLAGDTKDTVHRSKSPRDIKAVPDDKNEIRAKGAIPTESEPSKPKTVYRTALETQRSITERSSLSPEKKITSGPDGSALRVELESAKRKTPEKKPESEFIKRKTPEKRPESEQIKYKTPERKFSDSNTKKTTEEFVKIRRESFEDDGTPKTSRRLSKDEPKTVLSPTGRLRSTETIKRAKALFENIGKEQVVVRQRDILTRPSVFDGRKLQRIEDKVDIVDERKVKDVRTKLIYDEIKRSPSPDKQPHRPRDHSPDEEIPHYMTPLDRTVREHQRRRENVDGDGETTESDRSRGSTPDRNVPHYMLPLDRSLRERSPHKENVKQLEDIMNRSTTTTYSEENEVKSAKFGVTLRRTDSGRMITAQRKLSTSSVDDKERIDLEIEEIFDLEYLEMLLETIVGYDIRKRIRTQIRLIKRAVEENTFETLVVGHRKSPAKESYDKRQSVDKDGQILQTRRYSTTSDKRKQTEEYVSQRETKEISEYQSSYRRKTSSEYSVKNKSPSPIRDRRREPSPKKLKDQSHSPERRSLGTDEVETKTTTKIFRTDAKKLGKTTANDKPEWMTQKTLRKVSDSGAPVKRTTTTTTTTTSTTTQKLRTRKEEEDGKQVTDVITSSYGVGPTDENGTPLFGLKALRAQNKSEKTKVQGTVIRSQFYSENGANPEGEITVTKFSSDADDLGTQNVHKEKGIASVTTTQKFGHKGTTPSLKTLTSKNKKQLDEDVEYKSSVKSSKVTRRGSVKEISQKFIENAVDTLKSERQSSYPKAGLILRTSSFKGSPRNETGVRRSRENSPATQEVHQRTVTSKETTTSKSDSKKADTFLTNKSRVTGVQDVISRMKNEAEMDVDETEEDAEARNLLNKFIGSQVLLSGIESPVSTPGNVQRTIKITTSTTSSESSKPTIVTRTFTHPITGELLQNVWDEQTLKLLLEQSTDYEDRRIIRARLREVMAEQEACAELVEKASDEAATKESGNTTVHDGAAGSNVQDTDTEEEEEEDEEEDDDRVTIKTALSEEVEPKLRQTTQQPPQPQPDLIMQTNPVYNRPLTEQETSANNSENEDYPAQLNEKANRFNSKKMKMKRANTIDIPKPLKYYECDEDDSENENLNNRRNSYLALRGPIRVGKTNAEKKVPEFEPKTDSDRKFVAFLGKQAENKASGDNRTSLWQNKNVGSYTNNWGSKFGNIKNNFEKIQTTGSNSGVNSARNFWKSADDAVMAGRVSQFGPKISRQSAKNLQQMFEEKQKQSQQHQPTTNLNDNIVTGHLKVDTSKTNKNVAVIVTQPNSFNKFSHAPMSAFKPLPKKLEIPSRPAPNQTRQSASYIKTKSLNSSDINSNLRNVLENENGDCTNTSIKTPESPLYLYSPKQISPEGASPVNSAPWNYGKTGGESRVLSIAAAKFQNTQHEREQLNPPRRMSKEKIVIPSYLINQQKQPQEKLSAPYLVRNVAQGNSVRKLSGQYDSMGNRDVSNSMASAPSSNRQAYDARTRVFVPGENYTIQYNNQTVTKPQPKVYNAEYTITQQHYNVPMVQADQQFCEQDQTESYHHQNEYHNQQQRIYSKMQQTSPNVVEPQNPPDGIDSFDNRRPEIYNTSVEYGGDHQYTSNYQFRPQIQTKTAQREDDTDRSQNCKHYTGSERKAEEENETKPSNSPYEPRSLNYERQVTQEGVQEYTAVSSKVMSGPVSQQAVTVQQNAPKSRDEHDMEYNLKATLQKFSSQSEYHKEQKSSSQKRSPERRISLREEANAPLIVYNNVKQRPSLCVNDKPLSLEALEINERGESVLTSKFHIPLRQQAKLGPVSTGHELSKSESWHQICKSSQATNKPSPRASPNSRTVTRSKSSHTLTVPKQFEAGMTKSEMVEKKKTMEAYFGGSPKSPQTIDTKKTASSSINRVKTSQKISTQRQNSGSGLCRSKTLPDIVCLDKLDDSNIDAIFEDLFNSRATTRTTTYSEGPVTTTSQVTTRVTAQEQMKKPMSPFAKFRQLDKQNSLNSPPSTPKSPTGGGPLFKFTDPSLNQSANTVKQRLLQWCQMKTKEYENIQLDNFSTSWADGMAFCALIHHFLPDAFDFYTLNPRNRRHNFTLAFRVADEKAGIAPLLDVDDMVAISRPDWKCVFTYVQSIYRRFKDED